VAWEFDMKKMWSVPCYYTFSGSLRLQTSGAAPSIAAKNQWILSH